MINLSLSKASYATMENTMGDTISLVLKEQVSGFGVMIAKFVSSVMSMFSI